MLARGEQAILFLNRRGTATYVFCRTCGAAMQCPRCDTPLTQHLFSAGGRRRRPSDNRAAARSPATAAGMNAACRPTAPPAAASTSAPTGWAAKGWKRRCKRLFPSARVLRWDWETTRQKDAHEVILGHFSAHRADVLVGTQMLAKGLDLPLVTLVGIVLADMGLNLPDPSPPSGLSTCSPRWPGAPGSHPCGGEVILQTFQPEHYAIQFAARHDVDGFYARELEERKRLGYPPFSRLVRLEYRHFDAHKAESEAQRLAGVLKGEIETQKKVQTDLVGPVPCFFARVAGLYRWQIVVRGPDPESLVRGLKQGSSHPGSFERLAGGS